MRNSTGGAARGVAALLASLSLALGMVARAQARDLTEVLTEKGVLTPEEAAEVAKTPAKQPTFQYKPGSGFVFTTADGNYQLATGVWAQLRYTLQDIDDHVALRRVDTLVLDTSWRRGAAVHVYRVWHGRRR